ncbi:MAG: rhodanese-like domain-containing protein [Brachymonas sp.]
MNEEEMMKNLKKVLINITAIVGCVALQAAQAMTVEVHGNQVFATGPVEDDLRKFEEAFAKPGVDTVVLVNSQGGDLWTGLRVGRLIADKKLNTVIAGSCISACSIMFMGGKERRFSDAFRPTQTMIGIHGAHNKDTKQVDAAAQPQIYAFYKQNMGEKFNSAVINQALYDMEDAGSLLRVFDPTRSAKTLPYHCRSAQTPRDKCSKFEGIDALSLGIVTSIELVKVNLPATFKPSNTVFGRELTADIHDLPTLLSEIAENKCPLPACKDQVKKITERSEHRAIATAIVSTGLGLANNADTPAGAAVRAIYNCNHPANQPARLCEVKIVNGFDANNLYIDADTVHTKALADIKVPSDKFYASEEYGGSFVKADGLRTEKFNDITPSSLEGIKTVGTQELAKLLIGAQRPVLIDVAGFFDTIPGSIAVLGAGAAQADAAKDAPIERRTEAMLKAVAPDLSRAIVFFCTGRSCWTSANAAMRARKIGYTQVHWYRGGIEAWKGASLPTANGVVRAIANL